jgi:integrase
MKHEPILEGWTFMSNGDKETNDNLEDRKRKAASHGAMIKKAGKTDIFSEGEVTRLFNPELYADKALRLFYVCCLTAALRTGEARGLRVKQILFDREAGRTPEYQDGRLLQQTAHQRTAARTCRGGHRRCESL